METKGKCQHCDQPLAFDTGMAGTDIDCPHCGMLTRLFIPVKQPPKPSTATAAPQPDRIPPPITKIEDTLETIGGIFLGGGILIMAGCGIGSGIAFSDDQPGLGASLAITAIAGLGQGIIIQALFRWCAEVVRLLRAINAKP